MLNFSVSVLVYRNTANAKKTIIAQLFICKGKKIANAGFLENIADFCESYNLY